MSKIQEKRVLNGYQTKYKWYHPKKGHTGIDFNFHYTKLESPIDGNVVAIKKQIQMGNVLYIEDKNKSIHVFAHLDIIFVSTDNSIKKGQIIANTGNTGAISSMPHLHYEIITTKPINEADKIMTRFLSGFKGFNTNPLLYLEKSIKINLSPWEKKAIDWAKKNDVAHDWDNPHQIVADSIAEYMFNNAGLIDTLQGNISKVRLAEIMRKANIKK